MNIITFGAIKIGKRKFDYSKYTHNIRSLDIEKITSDKVPVNKKDFKYFIGYSSNSINDSFNEEYDSDLI